MSNILLQNAKIRKMDEFYTSYVDIEKELENYDFSNKIIYCNCDDYRVSNFTKYFKNNFEKLGIKKLISSCYPHGDVEIYDGKSSVYEQRGNGDFRSEESLNILNGADVIVTNPPFSMFREHLLQALHNDKEFVIMGTNKGIVCKEIFPYYKNGKVWYGKTIHSGDREFKVPDDYPLYGNGCRIDENGNKFIRVDGIRWFTNMKYKNFDTKIEYTKTYNETDYPKYDNYDAIHVSKSKDIPIDYYGQMGVPVTFIDKHNPDVFEIIGIFNRFSKSDFDKGFICGDDCEYVDNHGVTNKTRGPVLDGKALYTRLIIRRKNYE